MAPSRATGTAQPRPATSLVHEIALQPFLATKFDPIDHLNATLPTLSLAPTSHASKQPQPLSLTEVASQTQATIAQLSAQTSRLSDLLTQLTDEILRSGARLTYEVEVLRGETTGLTEALADWLRDDISKFVATAPNAESNFFNDGQDGDRLRRSQSQSLAKPVNGQIDLPDRPDSSVDPPYIAKLRTLTLVRSRLDSVIQTFGEAMQWTLCPSELTAASSFISVSAPESSNNTQAREQKGKEVAKKLRDEISNALARNDDGSSGILAATKRVAELRDLVTVWKGTAEEKARTKFVDSLARLVEDRRKALEREGLDQRQRDGCDRTASLRQPGASPSKSGRPSGEYDRNAKPGGEGGPGLLRNLQRLRDEIYLD